jgi:hypothetical protein
MFKCKICNKPLNVLEGTCTFCGIDGSIPKDQQSEAAKLRLAGITYIKSASHLLMFLFVLAVMGTFAVITRFDPIVMLYDIIFAATLIVLYVLLRQFTAPGYFAALTVSSFYLIISVLLYWFRVLSTGFTDYYYMILGLFDPILWGALLYALLNEKSRKFIFMMRPVVDNSEHSKIKAAELPSN